MPFQLKESEINHLRRLIAWVRCEIGQSPDDMIETLKKIAPGIGDVSESGRQRTIESLNKSANIPKYVRAAIRALEKAIKPHIGDVVDAEFFEQRSITEKK